MEPAPSLQFGDVVVHIARREVEHNGELVHLEPQAFDVLELLLRERERVVPKSELLDRVWGDQFVSESALTTRIKEVRRAVGDDGTRQAVIKNVRGHGYRFVAEATSAGGAGGAPTGPGAPALIGRDDELAAVDELLADSPVVTLVGPGGVGKTALAATLAADARRNRADGAIGVRLATVRDADAVGAAVRRAAQIAGSSSDDDLVQALSLLDAVLVLDNCEHVIDHVARLADALAQAIRADGSPLRVVATSRERLGIAGEQVVPVDVLDPAAARALFLTRANEAQPGFELHDDDDAELDHLLAMLDRLPLAIEMAAARMPALAVRDLTALISERLDERFGVLESPNRAGEARHRDLDALVAWSIDLLDASTRSTLAELSVFAGPVPAADVEAVLAPERPGATLTDVARLVDRSLIVADTRAMPTRYRMLETIRAHVSTQRSDAVARRHAEWVAELAERADRQLRTSYEAEGDQRLDDAVSELRVAHGWARTNAVDLAARITGALDLYAHSRHWPEPARWAAEVAPLLDDDDPMAPAVWAALAAEESHRGDYARAAELARRVLAAGEHRATIRTGPHQPDAIAAATISALESLSDVALYRGDLTTAREYGDELRAIGEQLGDLHASAMGISSVVLSHVYGGDAEAALAVLDGALRSDMAPGDQAWIEYTTAEALSGADPDAAIERFEMAIELGTSVDNHYVAGVSTVSMLALHARTGDPQAALERFGPVLASYRRSGDVSHSVTAMRNLIDLLVRLGDDEPAMSLLAALSAESVKTSFGDEARRLDEARATVEGRAGATTVERWMSRTAGRGSTWALDLAIDHLGARGAVGGTGPG